MAHLEPQIMYYVGLLLAVDKKNMRKKVVFIENHNQVATGKKWEYVFSYIKSWIFYYSADKVVFIVTANPLPDTNYI